MPVDESKEEVTERLREKMKNGEYIIEELIVPLKFIKTTLCGNRIEKEEVEISGRKIDITYIRKKLLEKNEKFMRKRSDEVFGNMDTESIIENLQKLSGVQSSGLNLETNGLRNRLKSLERTRHLIYWNDGYIVIITTVMFNVAVFLSDEEYFLKYGENIYVQSIVEKPSVYIIGRGPSNDQQILHSGIRLADISLLRENLETSDGILIRDKLWIFKGDSPSRQFQAGEQKGEIFFDVLAVFKEISRQMFNIHRNQSASVYKSVSIK